MASVELTHPVTGKRRITGEHSVDRYLAAGWKLVGSDGPELDAGPDVTATDSGEASDRETE